MLPRNILIVGGYGAVGQVIARTLANKFVGAQLQIHSAPGEGTTVTVTV